MSESRIVPTKQSSPAILPVATEPPIVESLPELDYEADPLFGSANLQRGFSLDPYIVDDVLAGGSVGSSAGSFRLLPVLPSI